MQIDQHLWQVWARTLQRWGVSEWMASLLEAAGPLSVLGANMVYLSQPLLHHFFPDEHLVAFAQLLEDPVQTEAFANILREEPSA
jgi:hypothetical protein